MAKAAKTTKKAAKKSPARKKSARKAPARKWSARVTKTSDALDLESSIFKSTDAGKIARSLKRSAEKSKRKKGTPLQSAMSMLNFYMNRAGKNLPSRQKAVLNRAKEKLHDLFKSAGFKKKS